MTDLSRYEYYRTENGVLYHGDCLEILPHLEPVDLVLKKKPTKNNTGEIRANHEEKQKGSLQENGGKGVMGTTESRDKVALPRAKMVNGANGKLLQRFANGYEQDIKAVGDSITRPGENRKGKRKIQERKAESALPPDNRERQVFKLSSDRKSLCSPQKREPSGQPSGQPSNTLHELPFKLSQKNVVGQSEIICLTDPPYGIGEAAGKNKSRGCLAISKDYGNESWDNQIPPKRVFDLMLSISSNQIIFGGNYFVEYLKNSPCWLVWDKNNGSTDFADCELVWTSFKSAVRLIKYTWHGMIRQGNEKRYHPTQKPVGVIQWILDNYSTCHNIILDPFLGSGTTAVACERLGRKWIGIELEEKYCQIAVKRIEAENRQLKIPGC